MASGDVAPHPPSIGGVWPSTATPPPLSSSRQGYERKVSSTILEEEYLEKVEQETVRYVEVVEYVDVPKYVTKKSVVEVEKRVPKYEYEFIEKIVEVPEIHYVDKIIEVPQIQEIVKHVTKKEIINVNKEIIKHVPTIEHKIVERVVEVPGGVIEVPKPYTVEDKVIVPHYVDKQTPVVIAQSLHPYLEDAPDEVIDIEVVEHVPQVIEVEMQVPKPVAARIWSAGLDKSYHRVVKEIPDAQFNSLLQMLNPHLTTDKEKDSLPFRRDGHGHVHMVAGGAKVPYVELPHDTKLVTAEGDLFVAEITEMAKIAARGVSGDGSASSTSSSSHQQKKASRQMSKKSSTTKKLVGDYTGSRMSTKHSHAASRKITSASRMPTTKKSRVCGC